jgi:hypothetical protein
MCFWLYYGCKQFNYLCFLSRYRIMYHRQERFTDILLIISTLCFHMLVLLRVCLWCLYIVRLRERMLELIYGCCNIPRKLGTTPCTCPDRETPKKNLGSVPVTPAPNIFKERNPNDVPREATTDNHHQPPRGQCRRRPSSCCCLPASTRHLNSSSIRKLNSSSKHP